MFYPTVPICFLVIGAAICAPERVQNDQSQEASDQNPHDLIQEPDNHVLLEKRSPHYDFGLGKRAYSYVSENKRLPVYNFGLGKRSRPYSFGLGKRSADEDTEDEIINDLDADAMEELLEQYEGYEKRARPYSFGLGKRSDDEISADKRAKSYNFGLGKRAGAYSVGLGKRLNSKFNFGLGKRERDLRRFNFGLGKRSDVGDSSFNYLYQ